MNICIFSPLYGSGYGTGYSIKKESDILANDGHKIFLIHSEKDISHYKNPKIKYFHFNLKFRNSLFPIIYLFSLYREINKTFEKIYDSKIDVIYNQDRFFGFVNKRNIRAQTVTFMRSTQRGIVSKKNQNILNRIKRYYIQMVLIILEEKTIKKSNLLIVKSELMKRELEKFYKVPSEKIRVISGGIDTNMFKKLSNKEINSLKNKEELMNKVVIVFAGRIEEVKGFLYLIDAMPLVKEKIPNVILVVLGAFTDKNYKKIIENKIKKFNLEKFVDFKGLTGQDEVAKFFNIANVIVFPSVYEPFGMIATQAVYLSKPLIVTTEIGALDTISDYPNMKVIKPYSAKEITDSILDLYQDKTTIISTYKIPDWNNVVVELEKEFNKQLC